MTPILWSFRRCPYAMRARLALASAGQGVALREVVLRDKPRAFLDTSPTATVPCLSGPDGVIDESLDIMLWALGRHDPESLLDMPENGFALIETCDGPFKAALIRYKYVSRFNDADPNAERTLAGAFLARLDDQLTDRPWLFGTAPRLADLAVLPFVRQFAHVDPGWFKAQPWPNAIRWLQAFKVSDRFESIMAKYPRWHPGDPEVPFP